MKIDAESMEWTRAPKLYEMTADRVGGISGLGQRVQNDLVQAIGVAAVAGMHHQFRNGDCRASPLSPSEAAQSGCAHPENTMRRRKRIHLLFSFSHSSKPLSAMTS